MLLSLRNACQVERTRFCCSNKQRKHKYENKNCHYFVNDEKVMRKQGFILENRDPKTPLPPKKGGGGFIHPKAI